MSSPRPNASHSKKYESFAGSAVFPGEDPDEFEGLVRVLRDRWDPVGHLENDLVLTIAELLWRKRRLGIFRAAANARAKFGAYFAEGDLELGVIRVYQHRFHELHAAQADKPLRARKNEEDIGRSP